MARSRASPCGADVILAALTPAVALTSSPAPGGARRLAHAPSCPSGRSSASSTTHRGRPWSSAAVRSESAGSQRKPASGIASRRTSCATRTRSSSPAKASRSTSSGANSGAPTSARTSIYPHGIDPEEIIAAVRARRAPMMSASARLRL
jgi:hypothetical protein